MAKKHFVIIVPGLGDTVYTKDFLIGLFKKHGLHLVEHRIEWRDGENEFGPKFRKLLARIDALSKVGQVSLIGTSAGGSAALNAFSQRKKIIYRMVNVCGRLRVSETAGLRSFARKTKSSPAFAQSVRLAESREKDLSGFDRRRILTVRPIYDEVVPEDAQTVPGATNIQIPTIEHMVSIFCALTVFSKQIFRFLR